MTEKTVTLVDLSAIFWAAWHSSANEAVSAATQRTISGVQRAINGADLVAICCDTGRSFRRDLDPQYKATRPEKDHAALDELRRVRDRLTLDGLLLWGVDGFEADDVIATATKHALAEGLSVRIATADKDLFQLVADRVGIISVRTWDVIGADQVHEKLGVWPLQVADWLALVGDSSDNIKGIRGVGPKRATELLHKFGTLQAMLEALTKSPQNVGTPAIVSALLEGQADLAMAQKLIALRDDVPIEFAEIYEERTVGAMTDENYTPESADDDLRVDESRTPPPPPEKQPTAAPPVVGALVMAPHVSTGFDLQLEPLDWRETWAFSKGIYDSRLYQRFPNYQAIFAVIIRGREMGLGALTALDCFHVIEGKPAPHAHLIIARAKASPDCEYFQFLGGDETYAEYETKHRKNPKPTRLRYTIHQAEVAGMLRSSKSGRATQWETRRAEMLRKTCAVQLSRIDYPEAGMGLTSIEELGVD